MKAKIYLRKKKKYLHGLFVSFLCVVCATGIASAQTPPTNNASEILVFVDVSGSMGQGAGSKLQSAQARLNRCLELTNSTAQVYGFYGYETEPDVLRWEEVGGGVRGLKLPPNAGQTLSPLDKGLSKGFEILTTSRKETQLWFVTDEIFDTGTSAPENELIRKFRERLEQHENFPWVCYYQFNDVPGKPYRMYMMIYYDQKHVKHQEHDDAVKQFLGYVNDLSSKLNMKATLLKFHLPLRKGTVLFKVSEMSSWEGYAGDALNPVFDFQLYYQPQSFRLLRSKLTFEKDSKLSVSGFPRVNEVNSSQYQTKARVKLEGDSSILTPGDTLSLANVAYGKPIPITVELNNIPSLNISLLNDWKEVFFSFESGGQATWDASFTISDATFNPVEGKYPHIDLSKITESSHLPQTVKQTLPLTHSFDVSYPPYIWPVRILVWCLLLIGLLLAIIQIARKGAKTPSPPKPLPSRRGKPTLVTQPRQFKKYY